MALDQNVLARGLLPLFSGGTMPSSVSAAVLAWSQAYASYAQAAIAGAVALPTPLVVAPAGGLFLPALDATISAMWASAVWVGPGATGVTVPVPPISVALLSNAPILLSNSGGSALQLVSSALHTYTLGITVTVTIGAATAIVPLT